MQLQILNSAVKTFLKCQSEEAFGILNSVFEFTAKECDNPDLRERGFMYWRLMSIDPNIASLIVLADKPRISQDISGLDPSLLDKLVDNLGTLATVYGKPAEMFVKKAKKINMGEEEENEYEENVFNLEEADNRGSRKQTESSHIGGGEDGGDTFNMSYAGGMNGEDRYYDNQQQQNNVGERPKQEVNLLDLNDIIGGGPSVNVQSSTDSLFGNTMASTNNLMGDFAQMSMSSKRQAAIPRQVRFEFKIDRIG